ALDRDYGGDVSAALARFTGDEPAIAALVQTLRIAHALYRPNHVVLAGGIGMRLAHLLPLIRHRVEHRLTSAARPGCTLACGDSDFHAARGAAMLAALTAAPSERDHSTDPRRINIRHLKQVHRIASQRTV
ncbi:MAG: hypothetical protein WBD40_22995, partial [Tepidisphaeraceae bacterium]